jgi:pyrimidine-nucleoside phosphorylase
LIASSIMSKKIAPGAQAIVLEVKIGLGAFMETEEQARKLAELMVNIAHLADRKAVALISDMNQPLGRAVGNSLEVKEGVAPLQGRGPERFLEHCLDVGEQMLVLGSTAGDLDQARRDALQAIENGSAWQSFMDLVKAQGGDISYLQEPSRFPPAPVIQAIPSPRSGYLSQIHARIVGETAVDLDAGRARKEDIIDHRVGIEILKEVGDPLEVGEELFVLHAASREDFDRARTRLLAAHQWSASPVDPLPWFSASLHRSII